MITVSGTSVAMLLVFTLTGLYSGFYRQSTAYIDGSGADLWVVQKGAPNFFFAISFLPSALSETIAKVSGVNSVSPLIAAGATVTKNGENESIFYFGYDTKTGLGGPQPIVKGSSITGENQVVVDSTVASKLGFDVGDKISVNGHELAVVGISGAVGVLAPVAFSSIDDARRVVGYSDFVNYFLVQVTKGVSADGVASAIKSKFGNVSVYTNSEWAGVSRDAVLAGTAPIIQAMVLMGGVVGILVIGLTNYTATVERQKEYGVLKALGITNGRLISVVLQQSIAIVLTAFAIGGVLTVAAARGLGYVVHYPILFVYDAYSVSLIFLLALLMGAAATLIPARRITRIDPAIAFK